MHAHHIRTAKSTKLRLHHSGFVIRIFSCAIALALLSSSSLFAGSMFQPSMELESRVDIRLESWLETRPHAGHVPMTVRIHNGDSQPHSWTITSDDGYGGAGGARMTATMTVEAGRAAERVFYFPVTAQTGNGYYYGSLGFSVNGFGVKDSSAGALHHSSSYGGNRTEFIGMSRKLSAKHWSALRDKLNNSGSSSSSTRSDLYGSEVDMPSAPEDWRGYSGLTQLWMDESEWQTLRPAAKAAILDWVAMGARVYLLAPDASAERAKTLALPAKVKDSHPHGAGDIMLMAWDGKALPLDSVVREIRSAEAASTRRQLGEYDAKWALRDLAGDLTLKSGLIFGFITVFGILIGPVNLFWLAPAGRRQRMFWTTPLLSLGGSLLLLAIMVLQDGVGGNGARLTLAILQPEQKRMALIQEQVSRTGVLLGRAFPIAEPGWMEPLTLNSSAGFNPMREIRYKHEQDEHSRTGDWFSSRSVQAHLLETVRPGRGVIEVFAPAAAGQPPSVLSSIETPLRKLFIVDESNAVWVAEDVGTGEKKVTKTATHAQLGDWMRNGPGKLAGPVLTASLKRLGQGTGCVFAEAADASNLAVPTLSAIRWTDDHAIIAGPYIKR